MDPDYAVAIAPLLNAPKPEIPLTVDQIRAHFFLNVVTPTQRFHVNRLPLASTYAVNDRNVTVYGGEIPVRCIIPVSDDDRQTFPVFVHIHGGGGCVGTIKLDDYPLRRISVDLQMTVINVEYRLAPEFPFPTGINDCYAALRWTVENTHSLKVDLSKGFLVGGHSAGGNFSAVLSQQARDDPFFAGRQITGQLLREPVTVHPDGYPDSMRDELRSIEENGGNPPLPAVVLRRLLHMYGAPPSDPRMSPLLYPSHEGLPPAYIQVMGLDPLRDDGVVYEKALRAAGVKTRIDLYPGVSHGFHYNFPDITLAETVRNDVVKGLKWLLCRVNE
ncbi:Alpha/Beta hydrolase protein [Ganoderma leucocontextum]|nr:Alpha/Beta hydrolase protein [Ganoderma leucocontextum]